MKVVGFSGYSGSGKTTLVEQLISRLRLAGQRVSVVKHAHHDFDIDHEGKDSWRHRQAGAFEVVVASDRRLAKIREYEVRCEPTVHQLIAELYECDWVLVEGFKHADLLKIEVWRAAAAKPAQYPNDPFVVAISTDSPERLPQPTRLPILDLNDPDAVAHFLLGQPERYEYRSPLFDDESGAPPHADAGASAGPAAGSGSPPAGD
jgi:molybdopterin-guanine dinucleotide biosynthesis protein B